MAAFLALLAFLQTAGVHVERVSVPGPNGVNLDAALVLPEGQARAPPIVALHGCGGPFPSRDGQWAVLLAKAGHIVLRSAFWPVPAIRGVLSRLPVGE
jgi:dipeptidyl aminopeptidase/acylaminoacyl peptidase